MLIKFALAFLTLAVAAQVEAPIKLSRSKPTLPDNPPPPTDAAVTTAASPTEKISDAQTETPTGNILF